MDKCHYCLATKCTGKSILCSVFMQSKSFSLAKEKTVTKFMFSINFHLSFVYFLPCLPKETSDDVYPDQKGTTSNFFPFAIHANEARVLSAQVFVCFSSSMLIFFLYIFQTTMVIRLKLQKLPFACLHVCVCVCASKFFLPPHTK